RAHPGHGLRRGARRRLGAPVVRGRARDRRGGGRADRRLAPHALTPHALTPHALTPRARVAVAPTPVAPAPVGPAGGVPGRDAGRAARGSCGADRPRPLSPPAPARGRAAP